MKKVFFFFLAASLFLIFPRSVWAAKFNLAPVSQDLTIDEEFQISIGLDTERKNVNGVQAEIGFSEDLLEVVGVSFADIFPSNFQSVDNVNGRIQIASGEDLPTTSFNGNSNWVTITLKAKASGTGEVQFSCLNSYILELETTSNLLDCNSLPQGSYSITEEQKPTETPPTAPPSSPTSAPEPTQSPETPSCSDPSPETPTNLRAVSGPNIGEVKLTWTEVNEADYYNLVFGSRPGDYQYGAPNIGNTDQYIVKQLAPGQLYYFAIAAVNGCASSGFSSEASARAKAPPRAKTSVPIKRPISKTSPAPTPTIPYQPVEEVMPRFLLPSKEKRISPTPTPEPEKGLGERLIENKLLVGVLVFAGVALLTTGVIYLIKRLSSPDLKIILPQKEKPTSPPGRNQS